MGKILGSGTKAKPAAPYAAAQFQPYSYTSSIGTTTGQNEGTSGFGVDSQIDPTLTGLQQGALGYTQPLMSRYLEGAGRDVPQFAFSDDARQREQDIFNQQSQLLEPAFAQQRQQLKGDLFGNGRMGLMLAAQSQGAGDGAGFVQPDAFGLGRAQSRTLADLAGLSRQTAQTEQQQAFEQAGQSYELNRQAMEQQQANALGGFQGAFGTYGAVAGMEQQLVDAGLTIEQARSVAQSSSASGGAALAQAGRQAGNSFFQDLLLASASGASEAAGTAAMTSDRRLKTNIRKVGELASGLNTYFWDWTEEAKTFVNQDLPTWGVMAQEARELFPDAISKDINGYLQVDYSRIS